MKSQPESGASFAVFFDGDCPLCRHEIQWLERRDSHKRIDFIDIAAANFDPGRYGKTHAELMAAMHGRYPDGRWTVGVDTFVQLYRLLDLGWAVAWTRWPVFRPVTDTAYRIFAVLRTRLPGRTAGSCRATGHCTSGPA